MDKEKNVEMDQHRIENCIADYSFGKVVIQWEKNLKEKCTFSVQNEQEGGVNAAFTATTIWEVMAVIQVRNEKGLNEGSYSRYGKWKTDEQLRKKCQSVVIILKQSN